ncbi:MAG: lipid-A-disaccharide synthase [Halioglobus sp.]
MVRRLRLGIVAGEASGDMLGGRVMRALQDHCEELEVRGIGGPEMQAAGMSSHVDMDRLAVMGFVDPLRRLPELWRIRRALRDYFLADPPDVFLGIDAPDFNLALERALRREGVRTAHLVSPSVWAWRRGRLPGIAQAVDRMYCLFPFETAIYDQHAIPAQFIGHPLADELDPVQDVAALRARLGVSVQGRVLALLPGSRAAEVRHMGQLFLQVADRLWREGRVGTVLLPLANADCEKALQPALAACGDIPLTLLRDNGRDAMAAADVVLTAAGTATLEAALLQRPMVVAYRTSAVNWFLLSRLVDTRYVALPNLLAGEAVVPEYLQDKATVATLCTAVEAQLAGTSAAQRAAFEGIRQSLRRGCAAQVARGVVELAQSSPRRDDSL